MPANVVGEIVQHRGQCVEEAQLLSLVFDLNFFQKQKRVDQLVLEESPRFAAPRDYVGWIRSV